MKKKIVCLLFFITMFTLAIQAQTSISYYVDGSQTTNGSGTLASPFNRIWYAINTIRDTTKETLVYIKAGRYTIDPNDFSTQLYIGAAQGSGGGKYLTLRTYTGEEGKVIIDGSNLITNPYYPSMLVISSARYVKLQNLVFRNLKNTNGYALNIQGSQHIEVNNCAFDSLYWTTTSAEYGYPTVGSTSNFIDAVYLSGNTTVSVTGDTLRHSAPGWGELVRDAGGNAGLTKTSLVTSNVTAVASDYYVALTGNDTTGSGSVSKPWRAIQKANQTAGINYMYYPTQLLNAPVTINLRAGTHKPTGSGIYIGSNRGSNNQWYTIKNYPGEAPVVDGSSLTDKFSALISIASARMIRIEGLKLTKVTNDSLQQYSAPSAGTKDTRFGIIVSGQSKYIIIKKNKIYDMAWTRNTTLQKTPTGSDNLNPLVVLGTTDTAIRNVIIDSNEVYNNVPGFAEAVSINGYVDSFAATHNIIHDNANIGIVAAGNYKWVVNDPVFTVTAPNNYSRNGFIVGNEVYRNISPYAVSAGIYLDGSRNVLVQDNESYENGTGISVGNEQDSSVSGYHTINMNVFRENLTAGVYYGSTNHSSWVEHCTFKNNTIENNYVLDEDLRAKANNQYGITDAAQRYTEVNFYRIRNSMFKQNTIESLSDIVLGFYFTQSTDTLRYNTYYVISEDACQAKFVQDKNNDGAIAGPPVDSIYTGFHKYALRTGYDQNSECEGEEYDPYGCGNTSGNRLAVAITKELPTDESNIAIKAYPNPVVNELFVKLSLQQSGTVNMQLADLSGRVLLQQQQRLAAGVHQLPVKGIKQQGITPGIYLLRITTPEEVKTIKIAVQ